MEMNNQDKQEFMEILGIFYCVKKTLKRLFHITPKSFIYQKIVLQFPQLNTTEDVLIGI